MPSPNRGEANFDIAPWYGTQDNKAEELKSNSPQSSKSSPVKCQRDRIFKPKPILQTAQSIAALSSPKVFSPIAAGRDVSRSKSGSLSRLRRNSMKKLSLKKSKDGSLPRVSSPFKMTKPEKNRFALSK